MDVFPELQHAQANGLQMTPHPRNLLRLAFGTPLSAQTRTPPVGQNTESNAVHHPVGTAVVDGANLQHARDTQQNVRICLASGALRLCCAPMKKFLAYVVLGLISAVVLVGCSKSEEHPAAPSTNAPAK